jgi:hypothetical protein
METEHHKIDLLHNEIPSVFSSVSVPDDWADGFVLVLGGNVYQDIPTEWTSTEAYTEWKEEKEQMRQTAISEQSQKESESFLIPSKYY